MNCNECEREAKFKCDCEILLCSEHASDHIVDFKHNLERISNQNIKFQQELGLRVRTIIDSQNQIISSSASLIKLIQDLSQKLLNQLEGIKNNHLRMIHNYPVSLPDIDFQNLMIDSAAHEITEAYTDISYGISTEEEKESISRRRPSRFIGRRSRRSGYRRSYMSKDSGW